jgi:hypothetical protein
MKIMPGYTYEELINPIPPRQNLANINDFEAATPCKYCATLVPDRDKAVRSLITLQYERSDTFPDFPSLKATARSGCTFCKLLRKTIRQNWAVRPMEEWGVGPLRETDNHWWHLFDTPWDCKVRINKASFSLTEDIVCNLAFQFGPETEVLRSDGEPYGEISQVISFKIFDGYGKGICLGLDLLG